MDACGRAFWLVARSAYPWDGAVAVVRRSVGASSWGSPPARRVSMLPEYWVFPLHAHIDPDHINHSSGT